MRGSSAPSAGTPIAIMTSYESALCGEEQNTFILASWRVPHENLLRRSIQRVRLGCFCVVPTLAIFNQVVDHRRISQRGSVTEIGKIVLRDLSQDSSHDFAGSGFRQSWRELNKIWGSDRADLLPHPITQLFFERVRSRLT